MSNIDLLPCPFCGGEAIECNNSSLSIAIRHWVMCRACHACSNGEFETLAGAISSWNTRTKPEAGKPFAYTTQTSIDIMKERPEHSGSFCLFLPFDGMDEIKGVTFVPLYAAPQPQAVITGQRVHSPPDVDNRPFCDCHQEYGEGLIEALKWYGEQARLCRLIHSEGDAGRHALSADGGKRANAALKVNDHG